MFGSVGLVSSRTAHSSLVVHEAAGIKYELYDVVPSIEKQGKTDARGPS